MRQPLVVRFELSEPYPQFLWTLTMGLVYPHEAVEHYGVEFQNHPVGTGPYRVDEFWIFDRKITFLRNPTWHEWDLTLARRFPINFAGRRNSGIKLQFQAYNLFNEVQFTSLNAARWPRMS